MKRIWPVVLASFFLMFLPVFSFAQSQPNINTKVAKLDIGTATIDNIIEIFGEPTEYSINNKIFTKENLPSSYIACYPEGFSILMSKGHIVELRFNEPGYIYRDKIQVGSSLEEVLEAVGQPEETIVGKPNEFKKNVLYKDINGQKGYCYYERTDQNVRLFFMEYKVSALYVTRKTPVVDSTEISKKQELTAGNSDINAKVAQLNIMTATLDDVIRIFGEPMRYIWCSQVFTRNNLPKMFLAEYPKGFQVFFSGGKIIELRHHEPGYLVRGKIQVGSSVDEVLEALGPAKETIIGKPRPSEFEDGVLYKDINGQQGYCFYAAFDEPVAFFFGDYKVAELFVKGNTYVDGQTETPEKHGFTGSNSFQTIRPIDSVEKFDDVRWKDMSKLDLTHARQLIDTLTFNQRTVWPQADKMPPGLNPENLISEAMNPGLGIRKLHQEGIRGKGVNVAIIDQAMYLDHPEFAGKIAAYFDLAREEKSSMHGPAVTSLLAGTNNGVAPDAHVYYAAVRSFVYEADHTQALEWIIEQNKNLPASDKIRVVSVSAAPGQTGNPSGSNQIKWNDICSRAESAGILVLDCTEDRCFIDKCWYDREEPDNFVRCKPGDPGRDFLPDHKRILAPASVRTVAEEHNKGEYGYTYCGHGGLSWSIPYVAGVLALGWQVAPELTGEQMKELLFESAYTRKVGAKIINPEEFIRLVKQKRGKR